MRFPRHWSTALQVALLLIVVATRLDAQTIDPLFVDAPANLATSAVADVRPYVMRSRTAMFQAPALDRALASPASNSFSLNLFDDAAFAVTFERSETSIFGYRTWSGHISDRPLSTVSLTFKDGDLLGTVTDEGTLYEIRSLGNGLHRIDEMNTALMPQERDVIVPGPASRTPAGPALSSPAADNNATILIYYSAGFRVARGGVAQAQARISAVVAETNLAYTRSQVNGQLNLINAVELPGVPEGADPSALLDNFAADAGVRAQRNALSADLVALLVNNFEEPAPNLITCGIAHVGFAGSTDAAFSVTANNSACIYTFTHETGHNLGAQHASEDGTINASGYPTYARAHKVPGVFRTVMAYACNGSSCPRVLNFSNPAVFESGQPTGIANQRENARRLNELFPQVAAYRGTAPSAPSAPQNLQVNTNGVNVNVSWQPPATGAVTNYVVAAGTAPLASNLGVFSLGLATGIGAQLGAGTYYVRVYAENGGLRGPASSDVSFTIGVPGPPRNLTATVVGNTVSFSWLPPATGGAATGYLLDAGSGPGLSNILSGAGVGAGTSTGVTGVPPGHFYVRLRAQNALGAGAASNQVDFTVGPSCILPSAPQNFTLTKTGNVLRATWAPPAGGVPTAYIVQAGTPGGGANLFNGSVGLTTTVAASVPNGTYFVRVMAINGCGTGPATGIAQISLP